MRRILSPVRLPIPTLRHGGPFPIVQRTGDCRSGLLWQINSPRRRNDRYCQWVGLTFSVEGAPRGNLRGGRFPGKIGIGLLVEVVVDSQAENHYQACRLEAWIAQRQPLNQQACHIDEQRAGQDYITRRSQGGIAVQGQRKPDQIARVERRCQGRYRDLETDDEPCSLVWRRDGQ